MTIRCDHPRTAVYVDECAACELLGEHIERHGVDGCDLCRSVADATAPGRPSYYLEVLADNLLEDAVRLYIAAGKDACAVELQVQKWHSYPPLFYDGSVDGMFARMDELKQMSYSDYLQTPEWQEQRRRARLRADGRCAGCATTENLETHHSTYQRRGEEDPADLTVLCAACHTAVHLVADGRRGKIRSESRRART